MNTKKIISKTNMLFIVFVVFNSYLVNAATEKKVNAKIEKAIVFLQGAQLFSSADFNVGVGTSDLIFEGVSPFIEAQTLQAIGTGNIIILDVRHNIKYPEVIAVDEKIKPKNFRILKAMEDSIQEFSWTLEDMLDKRTALTTEKNTLLNNRLIKGETKRDSLALLKEALEYLRFRLNNINTELQKLKREEFKVTAAKLRTEERLAELNAENQRSGEQNPEQKKGAINQVIVTVSSLFAAAVNIDINYFVRNAGWTPSYDLRATSANTNLKLDHKASVYQNSGIDWNDAALTLSTGTPNQGNTKPELNTNYLNYYVARSYSYSGATAAPSMNTMSIKSTADAKYLDREEVQSKTTADYTVVVENPIRVDYEIKLKYSIPSDSKTHMVVVQSKEVPSSFVYSAIPKLDPNAFLVAKVTDWESMNLIPGAARIYFDGGYIGETSINPQEMEDTLQLNMGRDKSTLMERKKLKDKSKEKTFNNDRVLTYTYEITLRNTKSASIKLEIEDQIPVSQNEEINVALLESTHAELDEATGKLKWNINLKPKEVRKLSFTYEVKYPKNKQLAGL
ncbi:MAG: mucoidy inhibitor MuiA family protein [Bacteroidetes bacterium]|nr:mucoidy inhibitor MuiA family protein [Bacteroidota bacterium]